MITTVTPASAWLRRFAESPAFLLPASPVLVVAPHPDDETLGAGGLIAALRANNVRVILVAVTDGENAYDTDPAERIALGRLRESEQGAALAELGVDAGDIHRLRMTDSGLAAQEVQLTEHLLGLVAPGMTLLAPWDGDFHPDHEVCGRAAAKVAAAKGLQLISYFFWTWHRGWPELLDGLPVKRFNVGHEALQAKGRALAQHHSQLERANGEPILPDGLLEPARWPFEVFLPHE